MARATLDAWGLGYIEPVAVLLVSELVANVVLHAQSECNLRMAYDGERLRVTVIDASSRPPMRHRRSSLAATGRGLTIVDSLSNSWGWIPTIGGGKEVWFELQTRGRARERRLG